MSAWWLVVAFVWGLASGVVLLARVVRRYAAEIEARLADLFDEVRLRDREEDS